MKYNSGETAPKTGSYKVFGPDGNVIGNVYLNKGETLPPTQVSGCHYEID
jgi:hypothetical protein